jgi:hypothetical protein
MGVNIPPLKGRTKHRVVIQLTGPVGQKVAKDLKRELDAVLDKYRRKVGKLTPPPPKPRV